MFFNLVGYVAELAGTALEYLQQFSLVLSQLCPSRSSSSGPIVFYSALSLTFIGNECDFEPLLAVSLEHQDIMEAEEQWSVLFGRMSDDPCSMESTVQPLWDGPTGVYKVLYLVVDGLTCCLTHLRDPVQKSIGEVLHSILTILIDAKGSYLIYLFLSPFWFHFCCDFFI